MFGKKLAISLITCVFALVAHPVFAKKLLELSDCSPSTIQAVKKRLYDGSVLRAIVFSRDVLHLEICADGSNMVSQSVSQALRADYYATDTVVVRIASNTVMGQAARDACGNVPECKAEIYLRNNVQLPGEFTFGTSGGLPFSRLLGHLGKQGHFEISQQALNALNLKVSDRARSILAYASRDPDFLAWTVPAAHAQTPNDTDGRLGKSSEAAQKDFVRWVSDHLTHAGRHCEQQRPREALYVLGYALHAIQDLAFHEGISNAEHSFSDAPERDIGIDYRERYNEKFALAVQATTTVLTRFQGAYSHCWKLMAEWSGTSRLSWSNKIDLLNAIQLPGTTKVKRDLTWITFREYRDLNDKVIRLLETGTPPAAIFQQPRWLTEPRSALLANFIARIFR